MTVAFALLLALPDKLHVWILVKNTVALDAILALPDCCEEAVFTTAAVTVAVTELLALVDICDVANLMTNFVTSSANDALLLILANGVLVLETKAAELALPLRFDVAVLPAMAAPDAAILALDCICAIANLVRTTVADARELDDSRDVGVLVVDLVASKSARDESLA